MKLLLRIAFTVFVAGLLAAVLVSGGVISDDRFRSLPSWLRLLLAGSVILSGLVTVATAIHRWVAKPGNDV
jgi:hypothetical protein